MHNWDLIFKECLWIHRRILLLSLDVAFRPFKWERKTTFGDDFDIADSFGCDAVLDTFNRAFTEWKDNYILD
jgi:hypothetical protein